MQCDSLVNNHCPSRLETRLKSSDLAHGRATATDAAAAHVGAAAVLQAGEDRGDEEGDEAEPQEGGGGLRLAAALGRVVRAVGDDVGGGVCLRDESASRGGERGRAGGLTALLQRCTPR